MATHHFCRAVVVFSGRVDSFVLASCCGTSSSICRVPLSATRRPGARVWCCELRFDAASSSDLDEQKMQVYHLVSIKLIM